MEGDDMGGEGDKDVMMEGGDNVDPISGEEEWGCLRWTKFILVRFLIVMIVFFISILIPNLNILLTFTGAILGTITNTWLPVFFYNRAFNNSYKNRSLEGGPEEMELIKKA